MGFFSSRKKNHEEFMKYIPTLSEEQLKEAYSSLDFGCRLGDTNKYTAIEKRATEDELERRGYQHMIDY